MMNNDHTTRMLKKISLNDSELSVAPTPPNEAGSNNLITKAKEDMENYLSVEETMSKEALISRIRGLGALTKDLIARLEFYKQEYEDLSKRVSLKAESDAAAQPVSVRGNTKTFHRAGSKVDFREIDFNTIRNNPIAVEEVALSRFKRFPLFQDFSLSVQRKLAAVLKPLHFMIGDLVIRKGEPAAEMFFMLKGTVSIVRENGEVISTLRDDAFFGEIGLLFDEKRTASVKAAADECWLFVLSKQDMNTVLVEFPDIVQNIKAIATNRNAWLQRLKYITDNARHDFGGEFVADMGRSDLNKILLFENADPDFLHELSLKLIPELYEPGSLIVKRGEEGEEMFLIINGAVEVVSDDMTKVFATMEAGSFFGEVSLLMKTQRTATVRAKLKTTCFKLSRTALSSVTVRYPKIQLEMEQVAKERYNLFQKRSTNTNSTQNDMEFEINQQNLAKVSLFARCDRQVLDQIASTMTKKVFKSGEMIVECGQKAHEMYFLTHGVADVISEFGDKIAESPPGSYFGEVGILHNLPRIASVKAKSECVTFVLMRQDLIAALQQHPEVMQEVKIEAQTRLQNYLMRNILA